ncbi:MAG: hypothetical protein ABI583_15755 [Betaproteobacteria bacterium]
MMYSSLNSGFLDTLARVYHRQTIAIVVALIGVALINAWPGLSDEIWVDEAFTLENYANAGMWRPFVTYLNPNNHVLFSALLAGWRQLIPDSVDAGWLRTLPLLIFLLTIPATYFAARRLNGPLCAFIACLMFASSSVTANHATQLRGYGPSWLPFALMLWSALNINAVSSKKWRVLYVFSSAAAVAILPSNLFLALILATALTAYHLVNTPHQIRDGKWGMLVLFAGPCCGLLAYVFVWGNLVTAANIDWSGWNRNRLFGQWITATLVDFIWFLPIPAAGLGIALWLARTQFKLTDASGRRVAAQLLLALLPPLGLVVFIYALPKPPFPRTFVPLLPVWYCLIGMFAGIAINALSRRWRVATGAALVLAVASAVHGMRQQPCGGLSPRQEGVQHQIDLCYQFFRHDFHPSRVLATLLRLQAQEARPIIADYDGIRTLRIVAKGKINVMHYGEQFAPIRARMRSPLAHTDYPIMVVYDHQQVVDWAKLLSLDADEYRLVEDTGYYKIYSRP